MKTYDRDEGLAMGVVAIVLLALLFLGWVFSDKPGNGREVLFGIESREPPNKNPAL